MTLPLLSIYHNFPGWLDSLKHLALLLHMFQDLIGLEGDELAQFIPSAGEKYALTFQIHVC